MGLSCVKSLCCCCCCCCEDEDYSGKLATNISLNRKDPSNLIKEIRKFKVRSLRESLQPVRGRINRIDKLADESLDKCHYPCKNGLTRDESAAIYLLGLKIGDDPICEVIQKAWESDDETQLRPWFSYLNLLFTALEKLPNANGEVYQAIPYDKNWEKQLRSTSAPLYKTFGFGARTADAPKKYLEQKGNKKIIYIGYKGANKDCQMYLPLGFDGAILFPGLMVGSIVSYDEKEDGSITFHFLEKKPATPRPATPKSLVSLSSVHFAKHFVCQNRLCSNRCRGNHAYDHCTGFYFLRHGCDHHCGERNQCGQCKDRCKDLRQCNKCGVHWCETCCTVDVEE